MVHTDLELRLQSKMEDDMEDAAIAVSIMLVRN